MPKYLVQASYTAEGMRGLLKDGGTGRRQAVEDVTRGLGGRVESLYYAWGDSDFVAILDFPDPLSMAAVAMTVQASGAVESKATVLLSPEDIDEATRKTVDFRPPGA